MGKRACFTEALLRKVTGTQHIQAHWKRYGSQDVVEHTGTGFYQHCVCHDSIHTSTGNNTISTGLWREVRDAGSAFLLLLEICLPCPSL